MHRYDGQHIAVLGLGESGAAAASLLLDLGARVTVLDAAPATSLAPRFAPLAEAGVSLLAGEAAASDRGTYDLGVLSPGIPPSTPLLARFRSKNIPLIGELEFAWRACKCPAIGITGSNGKTTTTSLAAAILASCGIRTVAAGNISPAFSAVVPRTGDLDVVTLEISSFQLETIASFRPCVAAFLNLSPNHLDRYTSLEEYRAAKLRIFENQSASDFAVVNAREHLPGLRAKKITFSASVPDADFTLEGTAIRHAGETVFDMREARIRGRHNAENIMAALAIGHAWGLAFDAMAPAVRAFSAPPHRCETVRFLDGVEWVNDSKSTSIEATEKALLAEDRPVVLIAGGKDKGTGFEPLAPLVAARCRHAVLIGEMAERIAAAWRNITPCTIAPDLAAAVAAARSAARPGDVVLFSPGTSSFDMFQNYIDRGDQFRRTVLNQQ